MDQTVSFGNRLREERERHGLSQIKFGEVGGVTKKTQLLYESGERCPDGVYLAAVAEIGVDVLYVITGERDYTPPPAMSAEEQTMLSYFRQASPDVRRAALGALLGASASAGPAHVGSQHNSYGGSAKHYGDVHGGLTLGKRKKP